MQTGFWTRTNLPVNSILRQRPSLSTPLTTLLGKYVRLFERSILNNARNASATIVNHVLFPLVKQVFTRSELQAIADLCIKHDTLCFSDEVYEWLIYKGHEHVKIGMVMFSVALK